MVSYEKYVPKSNIEKFDFKTAMYFTSFIKIKQMIIGPKSLSMLVI